ncbi:MAG: hypothetical protein CML19_18290 [Pusillimonas sp.]|nr:hypothetical protein [Pusillimonas sp.]|tara:strand:- start:1083 stop:1379 length:297 start_codon:yes stop_codon:yes gene_type:complete
MPSNPKVIADRIRARVHSLREMADGNNLTTAYFQSQMNGLLFDAEDVDSLGNKPSAEIVKLPQRPKFGDKGFRAKSDNLVLQSLRSMPWKPKDGGDAA